MIDDLYTRGIADGWDVRHAGHLAPAQTLEADVVIVGSGAGGGTAAEILTEAGLKVLMLEEGPLRTARDFRDMSERRAYTELYQEAAARATSDGAVTVMQGRAVGGTTVVNWTTSLRTPAPTLRHWENDYGLRDADETSMAPWFERMEARLDIAPWAVAPNENNAILQRGCQALDWTWEVIPRNVRGCWNLGYCGVGCPTNAKQSMLVTTIPQALAGGMTLLHHARAERLHFNGGRVAGMTVTGLGDDGVTPTGNVLQVRARHYVIAGGGINTPALLLRSGAPDPSGRLGHGTCIHPVAISIARFAQQVNGYFGAPQSIYSDQFLWPGAARVGYKLEVPPIQPMLTSSVFGSYGEALAADMAALPHTNVVIALLRDGFGPECPGGVVRVDEHGAPLLDYPLTDATWDAVRRAFLSMAELQFAAGAAEVRAAHLDAVPWRSWAAARAAIATLPYRRYRAGMFSAHVMGG
jgi:choline dehydrogenase-like flavoprotein